MVGVSRTIACGLLVVGCGRIDLEARTGPGGSGSGGDGSIGDGALADGTSRSGPALSADQDPMTGQVWGGDAQPTWKVFHNNGHGFDQPTMWGLPSRGEPAGFSTVAGSGWRSSISTAIANRISCRPRIR